MNYDKTHAAWCTTCIIDVGVTFEIITLEDEMTKSVIPLYDACAEECGSTPTAIALSLA
jgi:hypothetical protein